MRPVCFLEINILNQSYLFEDISVKMLALVQTVVDNGYCEFLVVGYEYYDRHREDTVDLSCDVRKNSSGIVLS